MPNIRLGSSDYLRRGELDGFATYLSSSDYLRGAAGPIAGAVTPPEEPAVEFVFFENVFGLPFGVKAVTASSLGGVLIE